MNPAPPVTKTRSPIGRRVWPGIAALAALALAGCGGGSSSSSSSPSSTGFRRAAEPAESPAPP